MNNTNYSTGEPLNPRQSRGWMCYVVGGGAPRVVHPTLTEATTEAERLARLVPGQEVKLLAILGTCKTTSPVVWS